VSGGEDFGSRPRDGPAPFVTEPDMLVDGYAARSSDRNLSLEQASI
jgi:hypothetical protein